MIWHTAFVQAKCGQLPAAVLGANVAGTSLQTR